MARDGDTPEIFSSAEEKISGSLNPLTLPPEIKVFLKEQLFFRGLPSEAIDSLVEKAVYFETPSGTELLKEGEDSVPPGNDYVFFLFNGKVDVLIKGEIISSITQGPANSFDELPRFGHGALVGMTRNASMKTSLPSLFLGIQVNQLSPAEKEAFIVQTSGQLAEEIRRTNNTNARLLAKMKPEEAEEILKKEPAEIDFAQTGVLYPFFDQEKIKELFTALEWKELEGGETLVKENSSVEEPKIIYLIPAGENLEVSIEGQKIGEIKGENIPGTDWPNTIAGESAYFGYVREHTDYFNYYPSEIKTSATLSTPPGKKTKLALLPITTLFEFIEKDTGSQEKILKTLFTSALLKQRAANDLRTKLLEYLSSPGKEEEEREEELIKFFISRSPLFNNFSSEEISELYQKGAFASLVYKPGEVIINENDHSSRQLFLLLDGVVSALKENEVVGRIEHTSPHPWFGEGSLVELPPSATVESDSDSLIFSIDPSKLSLLQKNQIEIGLYQSLEEKNRLTDARLKNLSEKIESRKQQEEDPFIQRASKLEFALQLTILTTRNEILSLLLKALKEKEKE